MDLVVSGGYVIRPPKSSLTLSAAHCLTAGVHDVTRAIERPLHCTKAVEGPLFFYQINRKAPILYTKAVQNPVLYQISRKAPVLYQGGGKTSELVQIERNVFRWFRHME